jgi:hypothetical protein
MTDQPGRQRVRPHRVRKWLLVAGVLVLLQLLYGILSQGRDALSRAIAGELGTLIGWVILLFGGFLLAHTGIPRTGAKRAIWAAFGSILLVLGITFTVKGAVSVGGGVFLGLLGVVMLAVAFQRSRP